ncbi:MAG: hypothetical protein WBG69_06125, partial [Arcobacteraceae bacterium]
VLNQINNQSATIDINCEHNLNIEKFFVEHSNTKDQMQNEWNAIYNNKKELDTLLVKYGESIKQRSEKEALDYSSKIEYIIDDTFALINKFK